MFSVMKFNPTSICPSWPLKIKFPSYKSFKYLKSLTFPLNSSSLAKITWIFFHIYEVVLSDSDHSHFSTLNSLQVVQILLESWHQNQMLSAQTVHQQQIKPMDLNFTSLIQYSCLNIPVRYQPLLQNSMTLTHVQLVIQHTPRSFFQQLTSYSSPCFSTAGNSCLSAVLCICPY